MSVVMLNETLRSMPDAAETLYAGSGILLPKSGVWRECHGTVAQNTGRRRLNAGGNLHAYFTWRDCAVRLVR
jgi:hypothetical protein